MQAGRLLTERLVLAAQQARERGVSETVIVGALVSALGCVSAAIARAHGFDPTQYEEFISAYFVRVFQAESRQPVYH